jgi:nucleotide-binding universal stress UspA family protein
MIDTIVVPLDGSELAEQALPVAKQVAEHTGAGLRLLQVLPTEATAAAKDEAFAYLRRIAQDLDAHVETETRLWESGRGDQDRSQGRAGTGHHHDDPWAGWARSPAVRIGRRSSDS